MRLAPVVASLTLTLVAITGGAGRARAAEVIYVDHPLTSAPTPKVAAVTVGSRGGSFGPEGWTTTGDEDAIWFLIPATLPKARVEVSVKGISNAVLDGEEHDLLVTYGDTDRTEPVEYSPAYRNNNFKTNLRIFGSASPAAGGRPGGANKLELRLCPSGPPGHSESCAPGCPDIFTVGYLGGPPEAIPWDPATAYRFRVWWAPGAIHYTRGVEPEVRLDHPGTLAPKQLRVRIGSPRHGNGSPNRMPKGITFKDLVIAGEPGAETPVCGAAADAGTDAATTPTDAGCTTGLSASDLSMVNEAGRVEYRHCTGGTLRVAQFWVGDVVDATSPSLTGGYEAGKLFVGAQSCTPGDPVVLSSTHGSLDCARTKVVASAGRLTVDWAIRLDPTTLGAAPRGFFVDAKGGTPELRLGWTKVGMFSIGGAVADAGITDVGSSEVGSGHEDASTSPPREGGIGATREDDFGGGELACTCGVPGRLPTRPVPGAPLLAGGLLVGVARRSSKKRRSRLPCARAPQAPAADPSSTPRLEP